MYSFWSRILNSLAMSRTEAPQSQQDTGRDPSLQDLSENNGFIFFGHMLPVEMCEEVFLILPAVDLVRSVTLVCRNWHYLLTDKNFWFRKVKREGYMLKEDTEKILVEEEDVSKTLRFLQGISTGFLPFNTNLIRNPSGKDGLKHWKVKHGGDFLIVECPPVGSNDIPVETGLPTQHCFASSYAKSIRSQTILLKNHGIESWMIDIVRPKISVSEWVSARWDCDSKTKTTVTLFGANDTKSEHNVSWSSRHESVVNREWYQLSMDIFDYPVGLYRIVFTNESSDLQFWAGNYGAKTAGSSVVIHI